jgi:hypothetical protein
MADHGASGIGQLQFLRCGMNAGSQSVQAAIAMKRIMSYSEKINVAKLLGHGDKDPCVLDVGTRWK